MQLITGPGLTLMLTSFIGLTTTSVVLVRRGLRSRIVSGDGIVITGPKPNNIATGDVLDHEPYPISNGIGAVVDPVSPTTPRLTMLRSTNSAPFPIPATSDLIPYQGPLQLTASWSTDPRFIPHTWSSEPDPDSAKFADWRAS
jgi:hypothetical protein